jgi:hypothetical protein
MNATKHLGSGPLSHAGSRMLQVAATWRRFALPNVRSVTRPSARAARLTGRGISAGRSSLTGEPASWPTAESAAEFNAFPAPSCRDLGAAPSSPPLTTK